MTPPSASPPPVQPSVPPSGARPVFFVSDRTGITAETLGNTLLTQFSGIAFDKSTLPFVNTPARAQNAVDYINSVAEQTRLRPLLFSTTVNEDIRAILRQTRALFIDLFDQYVRLLEEELHQQSTHVAGLAHGMADPMRYTSRIDAIHYAMEHDDGSSNRDLARAEVILIAPSRCGKTPTSMYLALQYGLFAANYPLTDDDFEQLRLPAALKGMEARCFGLTSDPERLAQVRSERRPGSRYASLAQCAWELRQAEEMYRRCGIPYLNSASMSIEEIATLVVQEKQLRRRTS